MAIDGRHMKTPAGKRRARSFAIPFDGTPGACNAITDVPGVSVGYTTLISGDGPLVVGVGPVRTGVTAILPRPLDRLEEPVFAGMFSQNGDGELTGSHLIEELGAFNFPITITNTHSCGVTRDGTLRWVQRRWEDALDSAWALPVAGETYDGFLNDINGHHVSFDHVYAALDGAASGPIEEGSVGGGTGMIAFGFKAGCGTASRVVEWCGEQFTVGAFVQANFGDWKNLTVRGVRAAPGLPMPSVLRNAPRVEKSSIIGVVATDAPFMAHQMKRLAKRAPLGVALTGGYGYTTSGDIFIAFSTANPSAARGTSGHMVEARYIPDADINPFFDAVVQSVEEAILNALVANEDMTGRDGNFVPALPHEWLESCFGSVKG